MPDRLASFLVSLGAYLGLMGLWLASIAYIFWDSGRRGLPPLRRARWILIGLLPLLGLAAYLAVVRRAGRRPAPRLTQLKRPWPEEQNQATLPAAHWAPAGQYEGLGPGDLLLVTEGPAAGQRLVIGVLPAIVGRGADAAIRLAADPAVSRHHASLYRENGPLRLRDLGSTHGTWLNGARIQDEALEVGDRIQMGNSLLVVQAGDRGA
jgi:hypothetical protein